MIAAITSAVVVFSPLAMLLEAQPVYAQSDIRDTPTLVPCGVGVWCTDVGAMMAIDKMKHSIWYELEYAGFVSILNASTLVTQQLAYDTAEWVASGGKGQLPLIEVLSFGDYTKQLAYDAAGEFIGSLSENFTKGVFGVNLCQPPRFSAIALQFQLTIPSVALNGVARAKPKCAWTDIVSNWDATAASLDNVTSFKSIKANFSAGGNDVAFGLGLNTAFFDAVAEKREAGILQRITNGGYKDVTNFLSGNVETPASLVKRNTESQIVEQVAAGQNINKNAIFANAFNIGAAQLGVVAASTFTNVLVTRLLGKLTKGLFHSDGAGLVAPDLLSLTASPLSSTKAEQIASSQFSDILTPNITSAQEQDTLGEMVACPDGGRTTLNCAINSSLEAALRQGNMTVQQAIDKGFINANFQMIPSVDVKDNTDPTCAQRAYCVSNLRKMRLARIVPVGWELAADSSANQQRCAGGSGCITLGEVIRHFDDCNDQGTIDGAHPWCHLIDPNWVLASFPSQCLTRGYSNSFLSGTSQRMQDCQDSVSCLQKDSKGACIGGYGYCLAEQTHWQFDALTCKEQNATCRSYTPRGTNAKPVGYLRSTLDYGSCSAADVGCMWYSNKRDTTDPKESDAWSSAPANRVYFNATIARCDAKYDGCTDLRRVVSGQPSLNLITNGSFEQVDASTKSLIGWVTQPESYLTDASPIVYTAPQVGSGSASVDGAQSTTTTSSFSVHQAVRLVAGRQYTISLYARTFTNNPTGGGIGVQFYTPYPDQPNIPPPFNSSYAISVSNFFKSSGCVAGATDAHILLPNTGMSTDWQRFECSFVAPPGTSWGQVVLDNGSGDSWLADGVKLEESETATTYNDGVNPLLTPEYLKIPPAELNCTGNASTDNPLCANYAQVCRSNEAGCQGYRSTADPSSSEIPAVLTAADACPASCVGYETFRKQASTFDLVQNPDVPGLDDPEDQTSVSFIPSTGLLCTAQDVGCESFTNIGPTGNDAEKVESYSYIRSCQLPDDSTQTYYTWEGSEASGYQLVTWSLQRDTSAPLSQQGPRILVKPGADGSLKDPTTCNQLSYVTGKDPDCRQFYDPEGNVSYAYESQTILADSKCTQLRKDHSDAADCMKTGGNFTNNVCIYFGLTSKSNSCSADVAGCRAYAGTQGRVLTTAYQENFMGTDNAFAAGANTSLSQSEESVLVGDKSLRVVANGGQTGEATVDIPTSPASLYELTFWAKSTNPTPLRITITTADPSNPNARTAVGTVALRPEWNVFRIGPFYGSTSTGAKSTRIAFTGFNSLVSYIDTIQVTQMNDMAYVVQDSWKTPNECDQTPEGVAVPQAMLGCRDYTDRTGTIRHVRQFTRLCRDTSIGCSAYVNTQNSDSSSAQRWDKGTGTCKTDGMYFTAGGVRISQTPDQILAAQQTLEAKSCTRDADCVIGTNVQVHGWCDAEITVRPADAFSYYIDNKAMSCPQSQTSCRAFGLPQFNQARTGLQSKTGTTKPFTTVYLKDDVKQYDTTLCSNDKLFCEAFNYSAAGKSGTDYFRSPGTHACEYREGVVVAYQGASGPVPAAPGCNLPNPEQYVGTTYDGWYQVGTDCPCYPELLHQGKQFGIRLTGDPGFNAWSDAKASTPYQAWSGTCPTTEAECTEFRDVNDKSDPLHPSGRTYYVINDERLDKESCNGKVDPGRGCVLFRDTSNPALTYNSAATFDDYKTRGYQPVAPLDCVLNPNHPSCLNALAQAQHAYIDDPAHPDRVTCVGTAMNTGGRTQAEALAQCSGISALANDTNIIIKVIPDRSCSQWLACKTGETVYDSQTGTYKSVCSDLALCNQTQKSDTGDGVPFCTSYVDRSQSSASTILKQYSVLNAANYASRPVGFGMIDYTGFSIPDHFQVVDSSLVPIGSMISSDTKIANSLKKDYRLAVGIPYSATNSIVRDPSTSEATQLGGSNLGGAICYFPQTGSFGVKTDASNRPNPKGNVCWLAMDQTPPAQLVGTSGATLVSDNLNAGALANRFMQDTNSSLDQVLSTSFPDTQCKAAPEADAPFGNEYVVSWDDSVAPPIPKRAAVGYGNANFCEYGEACACTYKRVKYGQGRSKFYEPLSTDVVDAVCIGGPRDGLPCVPNSGVEGSQSVNVTVTVPSAASGGSGTTASPTQTSSISGGNQGKPDARCGEGGVCTPISSAQLVRGLTGQCLEYDSSRNIAGDQSRHECLVWNPNPVFVGPGDQYHWSPTAGFQPPQSSGRYYCTSAIHQPRTQQLNAEAVWPKDMPEEGFDYAGFVVVLSGGIYAPVMLGAYAAIDSLTSAGVSAACGGDNWCKHAFGPWVNSEGYYAGRMRAFFYADWFTSDGNCSSGIFSMFHGGCTGNEGGASLDGVTARGTAAGAVCENLDHDQPNPKDENLMRIVTTGQGANRSYTEYAILFNPWHTAYGALGFPPSDWGTAFDYSLEDVIANFTFTPPQSKIECAYTNSWANGGSDNQVDEDHWRNYDSDWHAAFSKGIAQGGGTLNRSTAQILTEDGTPSGLPIKVNCAIQGSPDGSDPSLVQDPRADENGLCYVKTWELDYRAQGQQKFQAFTPDIGREGLDHLSKRPVYGKCDSANPWFAIRAVFEDTNNTENSKEPSDVNANQLVGPFQFVGLWVTACAPGDQTQYIYMNMKMNSADVCRELAETISKDSHDSAAFTDRNWANSGYSMKNGFSWNTTNIPFGASLATGDAGRQPLFMTGVKQSDVNPMNPPTFTSPGQTYFSSAKYPTSNWGELSNVFAKIYRIYGYDTRGVSRDDWACTNPKSPNFGQWCPTLIDSAGSRVSNADDLSKQFCGVQGKCIAGGIDGSKLFSQKVCNSFSGTNRGLDCTNDPDICHIAPMQISPDGALTPQYGSCALFQGYTDSDSSRSVNAKWEKLLSGRYRCTGTDPACPSNCAGTSSSGNQTGCTRAEALKAGAYRCSNSVRDPGKVKESIGGTTTYASYCTKESSESSECPQEVSTSCTIPSGSTIGTCNGSPWAQCLSDEDCTFTARNSYPSGSVNQTFYWTNTSNESGPLGQHNSKIDKSIPAGEGFFYSFERGGNAGDDHNTWFDAIGKVNGADAQVNANTYKDAFWPAIPFGLDMGGGNYVNNCGEKGACFYATKISSEGATTLTYDGWDDTDMLKLYPGFNPYIWWGGYSDQSQMGSMSANLNFNGDADGSPNTYPGTKPLTYSRVTSPNAQDPNDPLQDISPYVMAAPAGPTPKCLRKVFGLCIKWQQAQSALDGYNTGKGGMWANYGACESSALMFREPTSVTASNGTCSNGTCSGGGNDGNSCSADSDCAVSIQDQFAGSNPIGTCRGGGRDGVTCSADSDCKPQQLTSSQVTTLQGEAKTWCNPVTTGGKATPPYDQPSGGVADACWANGNDRVSDTRHPWKEADPALDSNICTHPAGYWPKPQYCLDPDDEYCGLFGYNISDKTNSITDGQPLPTDVTQGLYTPLYLNSAGAGSSLSKTSMDYTYADYYNPIPPHTAAPDMRSCQGATCRVSGLDTFSVDGYAEGVVNGGAGNHLATVRFYGWASDNQMPLRKVYVDWGDGTVTQLPDSFLKNHKPYCQTPKECSDTPGLTCQTDTDCPSGGGQCVTLGTCSNSSKTSCTKDAQCNIGGEQGSCQARTPFGNDQDACEEQFFEFRHAYSCMPQTKPPNCPMSASSLSPMEMRCSRSTQIQCSSDSGCPAGDHCLPNIAPFADPNMAPPRQAGCFDAQTSTCRFTPRLMLVDNWGWCTGECRGALSPQTHVPVDSSTNLVLHPNGGCYDASRVKSNTNFKTAVGVNECSFLPEESTGVQFNDYTSSVNNPDRAIYRPWIVFPGSVSLLEGEGQ